MTDDIKLPPLPEASKMYDIPGYDEEELKDYARAAVLADRARRDLSPQVMRDQLAAALEAAQMGLRYAVRVWVLSDEIAWSEEEVDKTVERIIAVAPSRRR